MKWTSIAAIYFLFWALSAFIVLPFFGRKELQEDKEVVPGQERGAPVNFRPLPIIGWTTLVATISFGLYYFIYAMGWTQFN
jgi:predicted secreted protein